MEQKILLLSGKKQSGKNTACNFIHGYVMRQEGVTRHFNIDDKGRLLVYTNYQQGNEIKEGMGILNLDDPSDDFYVYAANRIWPYVKAYSFADPLKEMCMNLFGLTYAQCYGTDEDKNTPTKIQWKDFFFTMAPTSIVAVKENKRENVNLTAREVLQQFGGLCRRINPDCWAEACLHRIQSEECPFAIITDARFPNEMDLLKSVGAKSIRLERSPFTDLHESETALDNYEDFDVILQNSEMSIQTQNDSVYSILLEWGWIGKQENS